MPEIEIFEDGSSFEKQKMAIEKAMGQVAEKSKSDVAKNVETRLKRDKPEFEIMVKKLVRETIDMYKTDDAPWPELVDDLAKALKAIETV